MDHKTQYLNTQPQRASNSMNLEQPKVVSVAADFQEVAYELDIREMAKALSSLHRKQNNRKEAIRETLKLLFLYILCIHLLNYFSKDLVNVLNRIDGWTPKDILVWFLLFSFGMVLYLTSSFRT